MLVVLAALAVLLLLLLLLLLLNSQMLFPRLSPASHAWNLKTQVHKTKKILHLLLPSLPPCNDCPSSLLQ